MSQTANNRQTEILREFEMVHSAERTNGHIKVEDHRGNSVESWIDSSKVVCIAENTVQSIGAMSLAEWDTNPTVKYSIEVGKDDTEVIPLEFNDGRTTHLAVEYIDMVCELFGVSWDTFFDHLLVNEERSDQPVLFVPQNVGLVAFISPFIADN